MEELDRLFQSTPCAKQGDGFGKVRLLRWKDISIHALREARRRFLRTTLSVFVLFQSTPCAKQGDLAEHYKDLRDKLFQSTPCAKQGDITADATQKFLNDISIHALREARRQTRRSKRTRSLQFQSTPCAKQGDEIEGVRFAETTISIHALREARRQDTGGRPAAVYDFNPRPARSKATHAGWGCKNGLPISIHALREARRHCFGMFSCLLLKISIHALREARRQDKKIPYAIDKSFQSTPCAKQGDNRSL